MPAHRSRWAYSARVSAATSWRARALAHPALVPTGLVVAVIAVSFSAILIRVAEAHPLALAFWRSILGAAALAPFALAERRTAPARGDLAAMAAAGAFLAVHFALFIGSLELTTVASSTVLVTMSPVFVGLGGAVLLAEPPTRRVWGGMAAAMAGAIGVALADAGGEPPASAPLLGDAMAFGGAITVSGYLLIGRSVRRRVSAARYATGVYLAAAVVLLAAVLALEVPLAGYDAVTWWAIAGLVLGPQLLGHTLFNALLSRVSATTVSVTVLAEPVGATLLAAVLLAELPAQGFWAAAPLVLLGVYLASTRSRRAEPEVPGLSR